MTEDVLEVDEDPIVFEVTDNVALVRLNRPRKRNAVNYRMLTLLREILSTLRDDSDVKAVVLVGDEKAFSSGQDLREDAPADVHQQFLNTTIALESFPKPTVAAISGWCIAGGLEMALACDLRIASENAQVGDYHANINSIGGGGAVARLGRLLSPGNARSLIFSGRVLNAQDALRIGLVDEVVRGSSLESHARTVAGELVPSSPLTAKYAKQALAECADLSYPDALQRSLNLYKQLTAELDSRGPSVE